jgi:hypothetical protein
MNASDAQIARTPIATHARPLDAFAAAVMLVLCLS